MQKACEYAEYQRRWTGMIPNPHPPQIRLWPDRSLAHQIIDVDKEEVNLI